MEDRINLSVIKLNITIFIIAHRPDTIRSNNRVLRLDNSALKMLLMNIRSNILSNNT